MIDDSTQIIHESVKIAEVQQSRVKPYDARLVWRRLLSEFIGTFLLVLVAAGSGVVGTKYPGSVPLQSAAGAAGLIVLVLILSLGRISGAHFNAVVTIGFALRNVFPWRRVPSYLVAQLLGSIAAALLLRAYFGDVANVGTLGPAAGVGDGGILIWEAVLTFGLITTILAVVNGGMNVGNVVAFAIAAYFGAAILWAGPIDGASMNPTRQLGPALVSGDFSHLWAYIVGPFIGMLLAVGVAYLLRGPGGRDAQGPTLAQGDVEAVLRATKVITDTYSPTGNATRDVQR
ncbi:MAG: aquaporin [Ktedonobacteraceae bacterium]|nr:aquaporin [Ktedonobacteraceae bacterium]